MFALGAVTSLLLNNPFLIPILGAGFAFAPVWYLRSTAAAYKKHLNEELETAISVITTSYLRSGDLLKAVRENIPYLNPPVKSHFEAFITESEMLNANMTSTINTLKMKVPNRIFHEWCNTLIQCQSDRSMKNTLTFTVQKFSDMRIIQSELEAIINEPKKRGHHHDVPGGGQHPALICTQPFLVRDADVLPARQDHPRHLCCHRPVFLYADHAAFKAY